MVIGPVAAAEIAERRAICLGQRLQRGLVLEVDGVVVQPVRATSTKAVAVDGGLPGPSIVDRVRVATDEVVRRNVLEARCIGLAQQPALVEDLAFVDTPEFDAVGADESLVRKLADLLPWHGLGLRQWWGR